jgi:hypothetical protein
MAKRGRINALDQLAASVLAGETAEFPGDILRSTYFTAKWDRAAARHLAQWAEKHGIGVAIEGHNAGSDTWIRFSVPDQRSP